MIYQNLNKDKRQDNSVCGDARTPQPSESRVGIRSTRQVDAFVNAERERRLNILHLSKDGDLFYFLTHSLTSHPLYVTFSCPFRGEGRGGRQPRELSPTPFPTFFIHPYVSPIDRFFTHPTPLSPLSNSKLATTHMGYVDRALAHSNIRPSGSSLQRFNRVSKPFVRIVFTF